MIVTEKTVEAINGIRAAGFFGDVRAVQTAGAAYELVAVLDGSVKATIDAEGNILYPATGANNG